MKIIKSVGLMLTCFIASSLYGDVVEWEGLMRTHRPHLPAKETRSLPTLKAAPLVRNGSGTDSSVAIRAAAKRALGTTLPDTAVFENTFSTDEESLYVAEFTSGGIRNRIAVYGQLGNFVPYYRIVDGLAAGGLSNMADLLVQNCGVGGNACVSAADGVLAADEVVIRGGRGETLSAPYERFYFAFVDDKPGANWAHPCRYVFISEDCTSVTVLYKLWRPRLSVKATGAGIGLQAVGEKVERNAKSLEETKRTVYNYARELERNGISYATGDKSKSYFVLISGGDDPQSNGIRFWSDTAMFYSTLTKKYGVAKDHIKVYVSDGNSTDADANLASTSGDTPVPVDSPKDLDGDGVGDVTGAATKSNVKACFDSLRSSLTANDQLVVFITSHGGPDGTEGPSNYDTYAMLYDGTGNSMEWLDDNELADYTSGFPCPVAFAIETCYSGGFIDDITATANRVIATACNHYESSFGAPGGGGWTDGTTGKTTACNSWAHCFTAAVRGCWTMTSFEGGYPWSDYSGTDDPIEPDSNSDGLVSFREAYLCSNEKDWNGCKESSHPNWCSFYYDADGNYVNSHEHPQYGESPSGFGSSFFMLKQTGSGPSRPANDNFASATTISGVSGSMSGSNVGATMETSETLPSAQGNSKASVWYKWTAPASGEVTFDTIGSAFDTVLGVYTGTVVSSLTEVKSDDDGGGGNTSKLTFTAVSGTTYRIAVYGYSEATGAILLNWSLTTTSYVVTFYGGGKTLGKATVEMSKNTCQAAASAYKPVRDGYVLTGWYDASGKILFDAQGRAANGEYWNGSYSPGVSSATWKYAGSVTAYANWAKAVVTEKYVVTFYGAGKTLGKATVESGKNTCQAAASAYKPTRSGYMLVGWYDASGKIMFDALGRAVNGAYWSGSYSPGVSSAAWKYAGNVTAYANWAPAGGKYVVTFYGGGKTLGKATVESGKNTYQAAASAYKPTRAGYVLTGWYDKDGRILFDAQGRAADGVYWSGSYVPGTSSAAWRYTGGVTAYANWAPAASKYVVTFYGGGKTLGKATVETGKNTCQAAASSYKPTRDGYVLTGWYDASGKILFDAQGRAVNGAYWSGSYVKGSSSATWIYAGNVTAYANWKLAPVANAAARKPLNVVTVPVDDEEDLFEPGEFSGAFADGEGTFALMLDEGLETGYLVTWTDDGGVACECEAAVVGDMLVLTTDDDEVYNFVWEDDGLVATRVE